MSTKHKDYTEVVPASLRAWWTPEEIANRWHVHRTTVYRLVRTGRLRAAHLGTGATRGTWRISSDDLTAYENTLLTAPAGSLPAGVSIQPEGRK
jgi:excisionase family DNA binding protein